MSAPIRDRASLEAALDGLVRLDPTLAPVRREAAPVPLRMATPDFASLARIVIGQQVSKAAAQAIEARLTAGLGSLDARSFARSDAETLGRLGLSRAKVTCLRALSGEALQGRLDLPAIAGLPADEALAALTAHRGIGPWTAQVFLLFAAGHRDVFPAGDVALQHATGWVTGAQARPDARQTTRLAARWAGERGAAARLLYAFYAVRRGRTSTPV